MTPESARPFTPCAVRGSGSGRWFGAARDRHSTRSYRSPRLFKWNRGATATDRRVLDVAEPAAGRTDMRHVGYEGPFAGTGPASAPGLVGLAGSPPLGDPAATPVTPSRRAPKTANAWPSMPVSTSLIPSVPLRTTRLESRNPLAAAATRSGSCSTILLAARRAWLPASRPFARKLMASLSAWAIVRVLYASASAWALTVDSSLLAVSFASS